MNLSRTGVFVSISILLGCVLNAAVAQPAMQPNAIPVAASPPTTYAGDKTHILDIQAYGNTRAQEAGKVRFYVKANTSFDTWTRNPTPELTAWMRDHYFRMLAYSPYFDSRLVWFPNAWVYKDAYAIKPEWEVYTRRPDWILQSPTGEQLYIPYACGNGTCPQFAADFGNRDFQNWWIDEARELIAKGYLGLRIDDVNMDWRVSVGSGAHQTPIDPRTGKLMLLDDYQRYMAEFLSNVRQAFPTAEIVHNVIWSATDTDNPWLREQILAADYQGFQRGVSDRGVVGGDGRYSFNKFLEFIDHTHELKRNIILDDDDRSNQTSVNRDYELAFYFLINDGGDLIGADGDRSRMQPDAFYPGYALNLGHARTERYPTNEGLLVREFEKGKVFVNPPGNSEQCFSVESDYRTIEDRATPIDPARTTSSRHCLPSPGGLVMVRPEL